MPDRVVAVPIWQLQALRSQYLEGHCPIKGGWGESEVIETLLARISATPAEQLLGYVVLTKQPDGSWRDDWDGVVHTEAHEGELGYGEACKSLGPDNVCLGRVSVGFGSRRYHDINAAVGLLKNAEEMLRQAADALNEYEDDPPLTRLTGAWTMLVGGLSQTVGAFADRLQDG